MAEAPILNDLVNLQNETSAVNTINGNSAAIATAFEDVLSLSGTAPNQMQSPLDMNGQQIINLPEPATGNSPIRLQDVATLNGGGTIANVPAGGTTGQALTKNSNASFDMKWASEGTGTVQSVGLSLPSDLTVTGSPITTTGTLTGSWTTTPTGTGAMVRASNPTITSPSLVTPSLGVATASSINGNTITTGSGVLTLAAGKTLAANNTLTLAGTDGTTQTFPATSGTVVSSVTSAGGDLTGTYPSPTLGTNVVTNAKAAQMAAFTIKGNSTGSTANAADISIPALTQKSSPISGDMLLVVDSAASNALKFATVGSISSAGSVSSIAGNTGAFTLTKGITNSTNAIGLSLSNVTLQTTAASPTGTSSTTGVMMGLGSAAVLTPAYSGRVRVEFVGSITNATTAGTFVQVAFGTGTAPSNGASATGTLIGSQVAYNPSTGTNKVPFALSAIITGLTPGTTYWFDLNMLVGSSTGSVSSVTCNAMEF